MGQATLDVSDEDRNILKYRIQKNEGWFVPTLHNKYTKEIAEEITFLKEICSAWLLENFHLDEKINSIEILKQEEIDRDLGLIGIKFKFSNGEGFEGESVAFVDAEEVKEIL